MGGDHGLTLQESPDPSHEGSAVVALVRGRGRWTMPNRGSQPVNKCLIFCERDERKVAKAIAPSTRPLTTALSGWRKNAYFLKDLST
jgi:hypothetical protein